MARTTPELTDVQWAQIEGLFPSRHGLGGRQFRDHRQVIEGIVHRYRCGIPWRDLPERFGPWQTVWKRHHRFTLDGTWDRILARLLAEADAAGELEWIVSVDWTPRSPGSISMGPVLRGRTSPRQVSSQGALPNYKKSAASQCEVLEAPDHGIGRSRGGLSTKAHALVDGKGRPLVILVTAGQANDSPMFAPLMATLRVQRTGPGRDRTTPEAVLGDKAYSSRAIRQLLRSRGITAAIPEPSDQQQHRKNRGSAGGRPVAHDPELYKQRNTVERFFNLCKAWRGLATRYDKHARIYRGGLLLRAITVWLKRDAP